MQFPLDKSILYKYNTICSGGISLHGDNANGLTGAVPVEVGRPNKFVVEFGYCSAKVQLRSGILTILPDSGVCVIEVILLWLTVQ